MDGPPGMFGMPRMMGPGMMGPGMMGPGMMMGQGMGGDFPPFQVSPAFDPREDTICIARTTFDKP